MCPRSLEPQHAGGWGGAGPPESHRESAPPRRAGAHPRPYAPRSAQHCPQPRRQRASIKRGTDTQNTARAPRKKGPDQLLRKRAAEAPDTRPAWTDLGALCSVKRRRQKATCGSASTPMRFQDSQTPRDRGRAEYSRARGTAGEPQGQSGQQGPGTAGAVAGQWGQGFGTTNKAWPGSGGGGPSLRRRPERRISATHG